MANPIYVALSFCICTVFVVHAENLYFTFPPNNEFHNINDALFGRDGIELTKNTAHVNLTNSFGWVTYDKSVPLWNRSSQALANFSTHFRFLIGQGNGGPNNYGEGLAFFMAPFDLEQPLQAVGGGLGLFNDTTLNGSFYQMVAVEFDTHQNFWDPEDDHVGIDVNSIFSKVNVSASNETTLKNGKFWDAWVDYEGGGKQLQVFLNPSGNATKPGSPILSYTIDLRDHLPQTIKVGLSAATGVSSETHTVYAWNFSCDYSWEISTAVTPNGTARKRRNKSSVKVILISVLAGVLAVFGFVFVGWSWYFRKSMRSGEANEESDVQLDEIFSQGPRKFSYAELCIATRNFSDNEKLGQGGFGGVYRGFLPGTTEPVAVKRISQGSKQGKKEYVSEVTIISKLRHRNLVQLLGWCHRKGELLLVYEFLPNGSLDKHLFGEQMAVLDWDRRFHIACDVASAIVYLHEEWDQRVVHRDIKASNVMLDLTFMAKLGDFGLARVVERDRGTTHTTVVAGTLGYLAPECFTTGKASTQSDVYGFGAVTLEIACGRRPFDNSLTLVEWVWDLYGEGKLLDAADERLGRNFKAEEMERLMLVGLSCSHPNPKARPTMREVVKILTFEAELPYVPLKLPVAVYSDSLHRDVTSSSTSTGYGTSTTSNSSGISGSSLSEISSALPSPSTESRTRFMSRPLLFHSDNFSTIHNG